MQTFDIIEQLKMMEAGKVTLFPRDQTIREAREIIERLREAKRMAGLIADERSRENVALRAALTIARQYMGPSNLGHDRDLVADRKMVDDALEQGADTK